MRQYCTSFHHVPLWTAHIAMCVAGFNCSVIAESSKQNLIGRQSSVAHLNAWQHDWGLGFDDFLENQFYEMKQSSREYSSVKCHSPQCLATPRHTSWIEDWALTIFRKSKWNRAPGNSLENLDWLNVMLQQWWASVHHPGELLPYEVGSWMQKWWSVHLNRDRFPIGCIPPLHQVHLPLHKIASQKYISEHLTW